MFRVIKDIAQDQSTRGGASVEESADGGRRLNLSSSRGKISFYKIVGNFTKMFRVNKDIVADIKILIILSRRNLVSPKATWHRDPEILFYEGFRVFGVSSDGGSERCGCVG
jgi:hypothetical protein